MAVAPCTRAQYCAAAVSLVMALTWGAAACAGSPPASADFAPLVQSTPPTSTSTPAAPSVTAAPTASAAPAEQPPSPFREALLAAEQATGESARAVWAYPAGVHELEGYRPVAWRGDALATGHGTTVSLLSASDLSERLRLSGHEGQITALALSPDGKLLASGAKDKIIRLWDAVTGTELRQITGHQAMVAELAFSPDGARLASLDDWDGKVLRLWEVDGGRQIREMRIPKGFNGVAFSPDGARIASCTSKAEVRFWQVSTGLHARPPLGIGDATTDGTTECLFASDFSVVASAGVHGQFPGSSYYVRLHEVATANQLAEIGTMSILPPMSFSPDGSLLAVDHFGAPKLWDAQAGRSIRSLDRADDELADLAYSPDGKTLVGTTGYGALVLWNTADGKVTHRVAPHRPAVGGIAFSPDGMTLAVSNRQHGVQLWDLATDKGVRSLRFGGHLGVGSLAFSPDGAVLAAGHAGRVELFEPTTRSHLRTVKTSLNWVSAVAYFADGRRIAAGSIDGYLGIVDPSSGKELTELPGREYDVAAIAVSPDGSLLAAGSTQQQPIYLVDTASGKLLRQLEEREHYGNALAFAPDGTGLFSGSRDGSVCRWQARTGRRVRKLKSGVGEIRSLAVSPDGKTLAAGGDSGGVQLWSTARGREIRRLLGHQGTVLSLAYSPDGRLLASGSADGTTQLWEASSGRALVALHSVLDGAGSFVLSADGKVELLGFAANAEPKALACRVGARVFPFGACRDRVEASGLLRQALARLRP